MFMIFFLIIFMIKVERILSPQKTASPLKRVAALGESPARTFSPLTSMSLHKLTTSPIINTQVGATRLGVKNH